MLDLDVSRVRAFVAAAECGNFTQAASNLFITQQAFSKRIAALERSGAPLFERHPGGVRLTERGRAFLPAARELLAAHDAAALQLASNPAPPLRVDVWGTIQAPAVHMARFVAAHPEHPVEFSHRKSLPAALQALRDGEVDVVFGNVPHLGAPVPDDLLAVPFLEEEIAGLVPADDPLAEVDLQAARNRGLFFPATGASPELVNYMLWVGGELGVAVDLDGNNASLVVIHEQIAARASRMIGMTGANWPVPAAGAKVVPAPVVEPYQWWLVRRRGWGHPTLDLLQEWTVHTPPD